jgi:hypothetical protein
MALSASPTWKAVAKEGHAPLGASSDDALAELEKQLNGLPAEGKLKVVQTLEQMAACPATADGLKTAWDQMNAAMPSLQKPDWSGSTEHPNRRVLRAAGERVLHGLAARGKSDKKMRDTIKALAGLKPEPREQLLEETR